MCESLTWVCVGVDQVSVCDADGGPVNASDGDSVVLPEHAHLSAVLAGL